METVTVEKKLAVDKDVCCPPFDPEQWDNKVHVWNNKLFLKDVVPQLFHLPLSGTCKKAITRMWKKADEAGAAPDPKDFMVLAYDPSPFKGELYMTINKEVPGGDTVAFSGNYVSKVFEGPYNKIPTYAEYMKAYLSTGERVMKKLYVYFPLCPKCAKKYGHNYIVLLAQV